LKQNTLTVYEREEVLIECSEITKNKNDGQPYWERFGGNGESCNLTIIEGKYGLKRDPPCLTILDVQIFYFLSASEILSKKKGDLWWEGPYTRGTTVYAYFS
jgi:hypothetical protein